MHKCDDDDDDNNVDVDEHDACRSITARAKTSWYVVSHLAHVAAESKNFPQTHYLTPTSPL